MDDLKDRYNDTITAAQLSPLEGTAVSEKFFFCLVWFLLYVKGFLSFRCAVVIARPQTQTFIL